MAMKTQISGMVDPNQQSSKICLLYASDCVFRSSSTSSSKGTHDFLSERSQPKKLIGFPRPGPCGLEIMEGYLYNDDPGTSAFLGDRTLGCRLSRDERDPCRKARLLTSC